MEAGQGLQVRLHGILKRINSEELRNRVTSWQRILASASSRFKAYSNDQNDVTVEPETVEPYKASGALAMEEEAKAELKLLTPVEENPPRTKSPVQQWVDAIPVNETPRREEEMPPINEDDVNDVEVESLTLGAEAPGVSCPRPYPSFHVTNACGGSDAGSHCSSMESLLEARKPDPEELLFELGFGGSEEPNMISRIPSRFLQPSKLKGISIDDFLKHQQLMMHTFQSGSSGYRGLTGPSHAMPSGIVGKIMDRLREAEAERQHHIQQQQQYQQQFQQHQFAGQQVGYSSKLARLAHNLIQKIKCVKEVSVLSPENRNWYESQGDKSPEPSNKRIIIGQQSFTFSKDGSLIESSNMEKTGSSSECASRTESAQGQEVGKGESEEKSDKGTKCDDQPSTHTQSSSNLNSFEIEQLQVEYKSLSGLVTELSDYSTKIGSEEEFFNMSHDERKQLQVGVIEAALNTYQKRLRELDFRSHFRGLLNGQLNKVTDLLDANSSPSVATIIKEMTCLLRHQENLKQELTLHKDPNLLNYDEPMS
ncbi:sperm-specific antigen 2 isoform X2 [Cimex lectularius]|uniref:ITPR-interacting domain-containing protein n=2 Tax=Cimex lectularius TaxID=79782 RepID=A0A8I6S3R4_CIMLE|nr:sperm-specific antigen 2 isoform X2 [Cimex lectularius]